MKAPPADAYPTQPNAYPDPTALVYRDGSINMHYAGEPGQSVNMATESLLHSGYGAEAPYMLIDDTGAKHFVSPGHGETGVMLTPAPTAEDPGKAHFTLLGGQAPEVVTFGEKYVVPGVRSDKLPQGRVIRIDMLTGAKTVPSDTNIQRINHANPVAERTSQFDKALARARALGRLPQAKR